MAQKSVWYKWSYEVRNCCARAGMEGLNEICTVVSSENIQLLQSYIVTYRKKLKEALQS